MSLWEYSGELCISADLAQRPYIVSDVVSPWRMNKFEIKLAFLHFSPFSLRMIRAYTLSINVCASWYRVRLEGLLMKLWYPVSL
jgi:hypothetical protein